LKHASRIERLIEPPHRKILKEAKARRNTVMNLSVGDIFIEPHPLIEETLRKTCGETNITYPPVEGLSELRSSIAEYLRNTRGVEADSGNILITAGASEAFLIALMTVLDAEDTIILPDPTYPQHLLAANLFDNVKISYYSQEHSVSDQVPDRRSIILLCSPNNPTGRVVPAKDVEKLADYAREKDSIIISDETYFEIFFNDNKPASPGSFDSKLENTMIVGSFSKNMGVTGLRVGFLASDKETISKASTVRYATSLTSNIVGQQLILKTLPFINEISSYVRTTIEKRLKIFMNGFKRSDLIKTYVPQGSLYIFPQIPFNSFDFCLELAKETGVVLAPGQGFGPSGEGHVRISFGAREEDIRNSIPLLNGFEPRLGKRV